MTDLSGLDKAREQAIQEIVSVGGINGGVPPKTVDEFWYQVAVGMQVGIPEHGVLNMARQVFRKLEEEWDDDYVAEDGTSPSLEAYETLYEALKESKESGELQATDVAATDVDESEDEDDSIGAVGREFDSRAETTQTNIETTLNNIRKESLVLNPDWQRSFVWKLKKQRRLIESIMLGLPIPSLLLFRDSVSGREFVIDGRQRLETISRFASPKPKRGEERKRFKTFPATTEGWREDEKLYPAAGKYYDDLPQEFKTKFDKAIMVLHTFIDLPRHKLYQIFKRYNTGAEHLKAAEIRNAVYQDSPIHVMIYRLAGEHRSDDAFASPEEARCASRLRSIMRNKVARYGAYDFIGRYFAFSRMSTGSVANATIDFMEKHKDDNANGLRDEFIRVFDTTCTWYEHALATPEDGGKFHAFLATLQMVSTRHMLHYHVDKGGVSGESVLQYIALNWEPLALETLGQKQNSTAFWSRQKEWVDRLEKNCLPSPTQ
jgi:hypothetical protein